VIRLSSLNFAGLVLVATLAAACTTGANGVRFLGGQNAKPEVQPIRTLGDADIKAAISDKTFQYTRSDGNGFITFHANGSFDFQDDAKGPGKGSWNTLNGQFCESFNGGASDCGPFTSTGDAYFASKSRLV
jgi:hypothetical protein